MYVFIMLIMCLIIFEEKAEIQDQYHDRDPLQKYWANDLGDLISPLCIKNHNTETLRKFSRRSFFPWVLFFGDIFSPFFSDILKGFTREKSWLFEAISSFAIWTLFQWIISQTQIKLFLYLFWKHWEFSPKLTSFFLFHYCSFEVPMINMNIKWVVIKGF